MRVAGGGENRCRRTFIYVYIRARVHVTPAITIVIIIVVIIVVRVRVSLDVRDGTCTYNVHNTQCTSQNIGVSGNVETWIVC